MNTAAPPLDAPAASGAMAAEDLAQHEAEATRQGEPGAPRTGVEIVGAEQRNNQTYYIMRDLRNGNVVKNVTRNSARRLWLYAIKQHESTPVKADQVEWHGDKGLWKRYKKAGNYRCDLVQRSDTGLRVYYGVTDSGMHGDWQHFINDEDS
ncbi:hypothetical protein HC928_17110 [bacterium]|nr:hypothetical protein [bacterium]